MQHGYFDLTSRQQEEALGLMIKWLLHARRRVGAPSTTHVSDEQANIYLGHLLLSAIDPGYRALCDQYVAPRDIDVFQRVEHTELPQLKSLIYRLNADHLLLIVSVFQPPADAMGRERAEETPRAVHETYGKTYYQFAATYARQRQPASLAPSDVLYKLADEFETYAQVLTEVRRDYFHFLEAVSHRQFRQFADEVSVEERRQVLDRLRDAFLDAYARWRRAPTADGQQRVVDAARQIAHIDPTFHFDPIAHAPTQHLRPPAAR